ncbi:adenosine deaminase [Desulfobotulus alkaliphilus]|uniref:adenosine deaminase n=1 Tax=Desulfobotulus alkaliphilus TaxID=622671 RepID=A0A562R8U4_9BACT|nr:CRISPR-associated ring nuclease [Desulfobotulus alkaliphilus]TWI64806.1 adenosine deaminase [Desulfobotulus alkaliphilus]
MKNILVTTLGFTWQIVPELIAFTNPKEYPLFKNFDAAFQNIRKQYDIKPVNEVWCITTDDPEKKIIKDLKSWHDAFQNHFTIRVIVSKKLVDMKTPEHCRKLGDLIYRTVLRAAEETKGGQLLLSLTGGRKTMSADMQKAGEIFGCHALIHMVDSFTKPQREEINNPEIFLKPLDKSYAEALVPVITSGRRTADNLLFQGEKIRPEIYPIELCDDFENRIAVETRLHDEVEKRFREASSLYVNYRQKLEHSINASNFLALYTIPVALLDRLKQERIGICTENSEKELDFIRKLPKAELHCHFGGILNASEIIDVALSNTEKMEAHLDDTVRAWQRDILHLIEKKDAKAIRKQIGPFKSLRNLFPIPEPYSVCAFLVLFKNHAELLDQVIFGSHTDTFSYQAIGIEAYESLGDLQGSALMKSPESIKKACSILMEKVRKNNVLYLELRCSPVNYETKDLGAMEIVEIMVQEFEEQKHCRVELIFIASRHGDMETIKRHIRLVQELKEKNLRIVGFDLAGAEDKKSPKELRELFLDLMKDCMGLTIHAGETAAAENIWEAVYHLNADRIGHGLKLLEQRDLMGKIKERKIAIELCPSSNDQIVGYKTQKRGKQYGIYPLRAYMDEGLRVTINTDNPGISRTDFSKEYLKAAQMSEGGLSLWEVFTLIRNSFRSAFTDMETRKHLLLKSEQQIMELIEEHFLRGVRN